MLKNKPTVVIGASPNSERYSYKAVLSLFNNNHVVYPIGIKKGKIEHLEINTTKPFIAEIDTVTLYVGPSYQEEWYDYIISLKPKRVIFNPGTENRSFMDTLNKLGIETIEACTLVMLATKQY